MALILAFRNISALAPTSDYEVGVFINDRCIARTEVKGHVRAEGWLALIRRLVEQAHPRSVPHTTRDFCVTCGASIPPRVGEGTCDGCDPQPRRGA